MIIGDLLNSDFQEALAKLSQKELPVKAAYKLKNIINQVNRVLDHHTAATRELLSQYGQKDSNGQLITTSSGTIPLGNNVDAFIDHSRQLLDTEVDVGRLSIDDLEDIRISAKDLGSLSVIFEE